MLGADPWIVEPRRDAVRFGDLAVLVLEQIGLVTVEDAGLAARKAGGVFAVEPFARGFRAEERRVGKECSVRVDLGGRRIIKKKMTTPTNHKTYLIPLTIVNL